MDIKLLLKINSNDLKLYAKKDAALEGPLSIVKRFSDNKGMKFGQKKCAKVIVKKYSLVMSKDITLEITE